MKLHIVFYLFFSVNCFGQIVNDGLKFYYPFNGDLHDYSGNGNFARPMHLPQFGQDHFFCDSKALVSSEFYTTYYGYDITFSCAFWLKITNQNMDSVQISGPSPNLIVKYDSLIVRNNGIGLYQIASILPINEWVHLAVTNSMTTNLGKLYVNGKLMQEGAIDAYGFPQYFGAKGVSFDELYYFNRVLTENEIKQLSTDMNNCKTTSTNKESELNNNVYPNPSLNGLLYIESNKKIVQVDVHDLSGKLIDVHYDNNITSIHVAYKGLTFLILYSEDGNSQVKIVSIH